MHPVIDQLTTPLPRPRRIQLRIQVAQRQLVLATYPMDMLAGYLTVATPRGIRMRRARD